MVAVNRHRRVHVPKPERDPVPDRERERSQRGISKINARIERRDNDLARQLRRASMSIPLTINEGMYSRGKNGSARLTNAMASAKESVACLEVALAVGYIESEVSTSALAQLDHLVAALWNMAHRPWR